MRFFETAWDANESQSPQQRYLAGIEAGLTMVLVHPSFLLHAHRQPRDCTPGEAYSLPQNEVAARLASFLWRSLPDEALLDAARDEQLTFPVIESETRRMLADPRHRALVDSFADQWLYLRNLPTITPDLAAVSPVSTTTYGRRLRSETKHLGRGRDRSVTRVCLS